MKIEMKTKYFFIEFYFVTILSVIARMTQLSNYTGKRTGFFMNSSPIFFSLVFLFVILFSSSIAFTVKRCPLKFPKVNSATSLASLLVGISMLFRVFSIYSKVGLSFSNPLYLVEALFTLLACVFFLAYSSKLFFHFHIKRVLYTVPLIYWLVMLILSYIRISRMALIMENALMVFATCTTAIFFLYFAKIANGIKTKESKQKIILFFGSLSLLFCFTFSIPQILFYYSEKQATLHNDPSFLFVFAATGVFIVAFLSSFFAEKNLLPRKRHIAGSERILPLDSQE